MNRQEMETCRLQAADWLLMPGWTSTELGQAFGVAPATIRHWQRKLRRGGRDALRASRGGGQPCRLSEAQHQLLSAWLLRPASEFGFGSVLWTALRVRMLIGERFNVWYHEDHVLRLLRPLGFQRVRLTMIHNK